MKGSKMRFIKDRSGVTMVELLVAGLIVTVLVFAMSGIFSASSKMARKMSIRENRDGNWQILARSAMAAMTSLRFQTFAFNQSFSSEVDAVGNPLRYTKIVNAPTPEGPILIHGGEPIYNDSFTIERRINIESQGLEQRIVGVIASRCVPMTVSSFDAQGSTLVNQSLQENASYVLTGLKYRPFHFVRVAPTTQKTESYVLCCHVDEDVVEPSSGCAAEGSMVPRLFQLTVDPGDQSITAVTENPVPVESSVVAGIGFFISFNQPQNPSYFKARIFQLYSACQYSGVTAQNCPEIRPISLLKDSAFTGYDKGTLSDIKTTFHEYSGAVVSNISNTGIIRLGN